MNYQHASTYGAPPTGWELLETIGRVSYLRRPAPEPHIDADLWCVCGGRQFTKVNGKESCGVSSLAVLECDSCRAQFVLSARLERIRAEAP